MNKYLVHVAASLSIGSLCSIAAHAADITWQQPVSTTGQASDVSTQGSLVAASSNNPVSPTVNGVHFVSQGHGILYSGFQGLSYTGHAFTPPGFGPDMAALVGGAAYGVGPATVTLQGLIVGRHYQVQLFMPAWDFNWKTRFTGGAGVSAYVYAANSQPYGSTGPNTSRPQSIIGTFVADATSQTIGVEGAPHSPPYDVLAAVQVREISKPHDGALTVKKKIQVIGAIQPPDPSVFMADVSCQPGGPSVTLELSQDNGYQNTATGIANGASCTVTEQPPVVPDKYARQGCHWQTRYVRGQRFRIGDAKGNLAEIVNLWSCKGGGGGDGSLHVVKKVVVDGPIPPPSPVVFMADVSCQPGGPSVTLELSRDNGYQNTATGIGNGASCTVTEQPPIVPAPYVRRGCRWQTSYTHGQRFRIGDPKATEAEIVNRWTCKGMPPVNTGGARSRMR